ncbi:O-methyltransferase [Nitrospina watsonii]|uniref:O-methyltransferase family protein n=1 Tax=Nitrospina watsonii TaxID=1323948 RepID=A0ABM9HBW3_9BACT|nr:class I SAM-dependent methyltransferase [Nitrospina watsonii]CAI2717634.1 O-methyltransferase family protein [Nitrospina watsonii]
MDFIDDRIERYAFNYTEDEGPLLTQLKQETHEKLELPVMLTGRLEGRLLKLLVQLLQAKRVLEIGTFSGYSALSMAEGLPDDGELFTCDIDPPAIEMAKKYFHRSEHGKKITLLEGEALKSIEKVEAPLDMVFIDADKANYLNYYEAVLPKVRSGGLIVVDNVLWSGRVLDPQDESDHAIHNFNRSVHADDRVEGVLLTVRDGVFCLRKK